MPEIYFRFCFLAVHIQTARLSIRKLHDMQYGASHSQCMQCAAHLFARSAAVYMTRRAESAGPIGCISSGPPHGPIVTPVPLLDDNKIKCHAIVQLIFMKFAGIVGNGSPHNVV